MFDCDALDRGQRAGYAAATVSYELGGVIAGAPHMSASEFDRSAPRSIRSR